MPSFGLFFSLSSLLIHLGLITAEPTFVYRLCSGDNYTTNGPFQANLNHLLSYLSSNASFNTGFSSFTAGKGQDRVNGLFLCRGDVSPDVCRSCVKTACDEIIQRCLYNKEAIIWYEKCMLRYSNQSIFSISEEGPQFYDWESRNVSNPNQFNQILGDLMDSLVKRAASGSSTSKFATGEENVSRFEKIYGLVQCTPDLSPSDCDRCLKGAVAEIPSCCNGRSTGSVRRPSCYFKYSDVPFYQSKGSVPAPSSPSTDTRTTDGKGRNSSQTVVIIVVPTVIIVTVLSITCFYLRRRRKPKEKVNVCELMDDITSVESLQYAFSTIKSATDNFSDTNKLGVGGFGVVYKSLLVSHRGMLSDGQEIAVKRLSRNSEQGEVEFKNEVALLAKLQHRNLVGLLGFCLEEQEKQLIYEFVPNRSLAYFLFDSIKRADLVWKMRYKIIEGIARGLYLHEDSRLRIIHRDLKSSNILLDADMNPKISDFGMARLFVMDQTQDNTNKIVGIYGYMPPEYAIKGLFSVRSDAFSFGVILLEIISGKRLSSFYLTNDSQTLLECAWRLWNEGKGLEFVDPLLKDPCPTTEVLKCLLIGLLCVQEDATYKPTMSSVLVMLRKRLDALPQPREPAFSMGRNIVESNQSSISDKILSRNEVSLSSFSPW